MLAKLSPAIDWFKYLMWFLISCTEEELVDCSNTDLQFLGHSSCLLCLQLPGDLINLRVWFWPQVKDKNMSYIIWRISNLQISLRVAETDARLSIDLDWEFWELKKWNMNISRHTLLPQENMCEHTYVREEHFTWLAKAFAWTFSSFFLHWSFTHTSLLVAGF